LLVIDLANRDKNVTLLALINSPCKYALLAQLCTVVDFPYKFNLFQVYKGHGWSLAEDHIHYIVGRQCFNRQQIEAACQVLGALLKPDSMQTAAQQSSYLNEFIHVHQVNLFKNL
jgi:hypothetical protein